MDDLKYEEFVLSHFDVKSRYGQEVMVRCFEHDDHSASMQINLESGLYICFSCNAVGGPRSLYEEFDVPYDQNAVDNDLSGVIRRLDVLNQITRSKRPKEERVRYYPESYLQQFAIPTNYWQQRGFTQETVERFQFGYSPLGNYVTLPMRDMHGRLLGVTKRYLDLDDSPTGDRYKYPFTFQKSENLFASWLVSEDETASTVALVEGALDTAKVWQAEHPAMGLYGSTLSVEQVRLLIRCGVRNVVLFFDNDAAGRKIVRSCLGETVHKRKRVTTKGYNAATDLRHHFNVSAVVWPREPYPSVQDSNSDASDPCDLDTTAIKEMLQNTVEAH
jgi:DNA primase